MDFKVPIEFKLEKKNEKYIKRKIKQTFEKNLKLFEKNLPEFVKLIKSIKKFKTDIKLIVYDNDYDLVLNGVSIYPKGARNYKANLDIRLSLKEVFEKYLQSIKKDTFKHSQFIYNSLRPIEKYLEKYSRKRKIKDFSSIIIVGLGLGLFLKDLVKEYNGFDVAILEDNLEFFIASLYVVDYTKIWEIQKKKGKLKFFINLAKIKNGYEYLFHTLKSYINFYPSRFAFPRVYVHYEEKNTNYKRLIDKQISNLLKGLGFFDDEEQAIKNAYYNYLLKRKMIFGKGEIENDKIPVLIIGSGPSLEQTIDIIKDYQDKAIIVSCGSSLSKLAKENIYPDVWVNLERVPEVKDILEKAKEYGMDLAKLLVITSDITHKSVIDMLNKENIYYFPRGGAAIHNMLNTKSTLSGFLPTVTNTGLSILFHMGFKKFYLLGVDLGTKTPGVLHTAHTIYKKEDDIKHEYIGPFPGNFGGNVYTTDIFLWSKSSMEDFIRYITTKENARVFNVSDGIKIEGTLPLKPSDFKKVLENLNITKDEKQKTFLNHLKKSFIDYHKDWYNYFSPFTPEEIVNAINILMTKVNLVFGCEEIKNLKDLFYKIDDYYKVLNLPVVSSISSFIFGTTTIALSNIIKAYILTKDEKLLSELTNNFVIEFNYLCENLLELIDKYYKNIYETITGGR
ncbi:MAG TPA: DUF115 domain-containing protein [Nautiliaceae bacterium]|nr:DUF115 domain-containing protein [Nautiliaceae bacterium]